MTFLAQIPDITPDMQAAERPWSEAREAHGYLKLSHTLCHPVQEPCLHCLCSIQQGTLTIRIKAEPGDQSFKKVMARVLVGDVVVSLVRGCQRTFVLSSRGSNGVDEVYCYTEDQTARNKWVGIFRRHGLAVYERHENGRRSREIEPHEPVINLSHGDCPTACCLRVLPCSLDCSRASPCSPCSSRGSPDKT